MRVIDKTTLDRYVVELGGGYAPVARHADVSRQFIWKLCNDPKVNTVSDPVGELIEERLRVLPGTLFAREGERVERRPRRRDPVAA